MQAVRLPYDDWILADDPQPDNPDNVSILPVQNIWFGDSRRSRTSPIDEKILPGYTTPATFKLASDHRLASGFW